MSIDMNKYILGLKREYWEYRRMVFVVPAIFSVLVILASMAATFATHHGERDLKDVFHSQSNEQESATAESATTESEDSDIKEQKTVEEQSAEEEKTEASKPLTAKEKAARKTELKKRTPMEFAGIYIAIAWLTSIVYLLSSMYADRKDKSVLYWKSLPVSESQNAITKLIFGGIGIPLIALLVAWAVYLLLMMLGLGAVKSLGGGENWEFIERSIDVSRLFIWPLAGIAVGVIWGAPLFCFTLMVSAMSKRLPFFMLVLPWIIIAALESIFFSSRHLAGFFFSHFPFVVIDEFAEMSSIGELLNTFFIQRGGSLIAGLLMSAGFVVTAVWYRNNRFEI